MLKLSVHKVFLLLIAYGSMTFAMTAEQISELTNGQGTFIITLHNNSNKIQSITIHAMATTENNESPYVVEKGVVLQPGENKKVLVQRPLIDESQIFNESTDYIKLPEARQKISNLRVKLSIISSSRRQNQYKHFTPEYVGNTVFANITDFEFTIE